MTANARAPSLVHEQALWAQGHMRVAGVDEVGRGCLAGPVLAAAVLLPAYCQPIAGVKDSKQLSPTRRRQLFHVIRSQAVAIAYGAASVAEIDQHNILNATYLAMQRALRRLSAPGYGGVPGCGGVPGYGGVPAYDHALIDGRDSRHHALGPHTAIIGGDRTSYAIACASICAKVARDQLMQQLALRYPGYGWEHNAGYGTASHCQALIQLGITPLHRRSFAPVRAASQNRTSGNATL